MDTDYYFFEARTDVSFGNELTFKLYTFSDFEYSSETMSMLAPSGTTSIYFLQDKFIIGFEPQTSSYRASILTNNKSDIYNWDWYFAGEAYYVLLSDESNS